MAGEEYPGVKDNIDQSLDLSTTYEEIVLPGQPDRLLVRQVGEAEGDLLTFEKSGTEWQPILARPGPLPASRGRAQPSSGGDHDIVAGYIDFLLKAGGPGFSSATGPDGGNLACLWTVRHIVRDCLDRWITQTDGTEYFGQELRADFGDGQSLSDAMNGWLIISPTVSSGSGRNIGHVGFLGAPSGDATLIYSNSSSRARLEQNFTLAAWKDRYEKRKRLKVLFYPLPNYGSSVA